MNHKFTMFEKGLWSISCFALIVLYFWNPNRDILTLIASIIGVTALIFLAKGNAKGQLLTILFSLLYGVISYKFQYYGEMITYLGMTAPIAALSAYKWIKNPYSKNEVKVAHMTIKKAVWIAILTGIVTFGFYFVLKYFHTNNLIVSTVSIATSFSASSLMVCRSPYYAVAYGCNDIVLIILWILATMKELSFLPMVLCFVIFLINDIYGFVNWSNMKQQQNI